MQWTKKLLSSKYFCKYNENEKLKGIFIIRFNI